jgi:peptide deformylase
MRILSAFNKRDLEILKTPCTEVNISPAMKVLIRDMHYTLEKSKIGVGLAAPQVGVNKRIFVVQYYKEYMTIINPVILDRNSDIRTESEGCLSVPHINVLIPRSESIKVAYTRMDGVRLHEVELRAFVARIFQHEYDHLEGKLIVDITQETGYSL